MKDLFPAFATPQSASGTWITSLDVLDALNPRTVIGAHYPVADATVIRDYRELLASLRVRVS